MKKIFYCWQATTKGNRSYIESCLKAAAKEFPDYTIDEATRGKRGAVDIYESILSKISECDLFVADVSTINSEYSEMRKMINTNVAFETGYAIACKSKEDMVLIANRLTTNDADRPIDLRNLRTVYVEFTNENKKNLIEVFKEAIRSHSQEAALPDRDPKITAELAAHSREGMMHVKFDSHEDEYFVLNAFELGGREVYMDFTLTPSQRTELNGMSGLPHLPYEKKVKHISYVISNHICSYRIKQKIDLTMHPTGGYDLQKFDHRHAEVQKLNLWRSKPTIEEVPTSADGKEYKVTDYDTEKSFTLKISSTAFVELGSRYVDDQEFIARRFAYAFNNKYEGQRMEQIEVTSFDLRGDLNATIESIK